MHAIQSAIESLHAGERCPRLHVDVTREGVVCPDFVQEQWKERLVIDLDGSYPLNLAFTEIGVEADLSFGGFVTRCVFPYAAIYVVVDRETGRGLVFDEAMPESVRQQRAAATAKPKPKPGPKLVVQGDPEDGEGGGDDGVDPALSKVSADAGARRPRRRRRKKKDGDGEPKPASAAEVELEPATAAEVEVAVAEVAAAEAEPALAAEAAEAAAGEPEPEPEPEVEGGTPAPEEPSASEVEAKNRRAAFKVIGGGGD